MLGNHIGYSQRHTTTGTFHTSAPCWQVLNDVVAIVKFLLDGQGVCAAQPLLWKRLPLNVWLLATVCIAEDETQIAGINPL